MGTPQPITARQFTAPAKAVHRRDFLRQSAVAGTGLAFAGYFTSRAAAESKSPNEKLNVACIGVSGQGGYSVSGVSGENIVALCDVDEKRLADVAMKFPMAKTHVDYRKMFDEQKDIDAITCATPDHCHAPISMAAIKLGKHVYCEKPLTHNVYEARQVAKAAKEMKVASQMGTQIHAGNNYRRVVEILQSGAIGPVKEVHVWVGKAWGGGDRPTDMPPVPKELHWDLWLGPAPARPYNPIYHPFHWRKFWDFGGGTLADMACHFMDLPFWALDLRYPDTIEATAEAVHAETAPLGTMVTYEFPARGDKPPVKLIWRDGDKIPMEIGPVKVGGNGVMFVGEKGQMLADYGSYKLFPEPDFAGFKPPAETIPNSIGHHAEWIKACKDGSPTTCNFDYSGALTEAVLLGNVSLRAGCKLEWDGEAMQAKNCPAAEAFIKGAYREGWTL